LITSAKAMAAAHYGAQLGAAEERYVETLAEFAHAYMSYHGLLQVDQMLAEQQRDFHDLYLQTFAYRLLSAGPRERKVLVDEGNDDRSETLTLRLHFPGSLDKPPVVRIAGVAIEMAPQDTGSSGRSAYWEARIGADKLPDDVDEAVLEVSLADGSKPDAEL